MGLYDPANNLEIPGLEATLEYGDASQVVKDRIPGAMLINDQSVLDRVRLTQIDGLHDDPEGSESRQPNADRHGERAGNLLYRGRTIGLTGRVEAGNIGAMRSNWRRFRRQFGTRERDLIIHHPLEVPALVNEVRNPSLSFDATAWTTFSQGYTGSLSAPAGGVTDGIASVGELPFTSSGASGSVGVGEQLFNNLPTTSELKRWGGEDLWIRAMVKIQAAAVAVSSLQVGVLCLRDVNHDAKTSTAGLIAGTVSTASRFSPVTGTWYELYGRVLPTSLFSDTQYVSPLVLVNIAGAGAYTMRFYDVAMVRLDAAETTPAFYFDGDTSGFDWIATRRRSPSIGPTHAENKILDPRFEGYSTPQRTLTTWGYLSAFMTINEVPFAATNWRGNHVDGALYFDATKDGTSTARAMGVMPLDAAGNSYYRVNPNRTYRFSARVKITLKPSDSDTVISIVWLDVSGATISTSSSIAMTTSAQDRSVTATAPAGAYAARLMIWNPATTSASASLRLYVSDPCFLDVTDYDPGDFFGVGDVAEEAGSRRRIPRPFLIKGVRKTSDMKAPEQQTRSRAWRDFTMSLRASDPRVYGIDARRQAIRLPTATYKFVSAYPIVFTTETAPAPVPSGFTYEGHSIPANVAWTRDSARI